MPDQSSAASEHAILQEITVPLEKLPHDPVAAVHADFPVALRGYDRLAVDEYVQRTSQLVAELQSTRSPDAAIRRALERLGEQISGILQRAHDTAEQITSQSRSEAEDRLEAARQESIQITAAAEQRVRDLDADTDRIWEERHRIVDDTRELARQLLALADTAAERFPPAEESEELQVPDLGLQATGLADSELGDAEAAVFDADAPSAGDEAAAVFGQDPLLETPDSEATAAFTAPGASADEPPAYEPRVEDPDATAVFSVPEYDEEPSVEVRGYEDPRGGAHEYGEPGAHEYGEPGPEVHEYADPSAHAFGASGHEYDEDSEDEYDEDPAFPPSTPGGTRGSARK